MTIKNLAQKLEYLFTQKVKPDGGHYTQEEVVAALKGSKGEISRVYLWKLRTGKATNPSIEVVQALAIFFGVSPNYFFEQETASPTPGTRDELVEAIALRAGKLDDEGKRTVLEMINYISQLKDKRQGE